ncbi:permease prefix domain 1-containing protein [Kurthia huakuii]|uniref:permease prefix domain 1-containing protein n=1 Tax=Kurthia huakuii TaxID=1421019 RepID=UPI0004966E22|nr:permease prefix domain 1-containing protein [Kurthia huakuii]MBM7698793.1 hypothetical protein [Kurthia huakuii]
MTIESYVQQILQRVEISKRQHYDLTTEMTTYLEEKKQHYKQQGLSEEAALERTFRDFGEIEAVGKSLSTALFPQRRWALWYLAFAAVVYAVLVGTVVAVKPPLIWSILLCVSALISIAFIRKQFYIAHYRGLFLLFCSMHIVLWAIGILYLDQAQGIVLFMLRGCSILYLGAIIYNICLGALYQPIIQQYEALSFKKRTFTIMINAISGIVIISYFLLFVAGVWFFGIDSTNLTYTLESLQMLVIPTTMLCCWFAVIMASKLHRYMIPVSWVIQLALLCAVVIRFYS